jgi:hypothetical protein
MKMNDNQITILILILFYGGSILSFIFWIWALVDALLSKFETDITKIIWLLVLIFIPLLGFILYYFIGTKQKVKEKTKEDLS